MDRRAPASSEQQCPLALHIAQPHQFPRKHQRGTMVGPSHQLHRPRQPRTLNDQRIRHVGIQSSRRPPIRRPLIHRRLALHRRLLLGRRKLLASAKASTTARLLQPALAQKGRGLYTPRHTHQPGPCRRDMQPSRE